jgi:hypothetical protein
VTPRQNDDSIGLAHHDGYREVSSTVDSRTRVDNRLLADLDVIGSDVFSVNYNVERFRSSRSRREDQQGSDHHGDGSIHGDTKERYDRKLWIWPSMKKAA